MPQPKKSPEKRARPTTITLDPMVHALALERARRLGWSFSKFLSGLIIGDEAAREPQLREGSPGLAAEVPGRPAVAGVATPVSKLPSWVR